ncbi:tRNA-splicing endonuclease subunit Sen2-1-like [Punica granatum]|uniref:tRNA-splicing endonuclease subunit Sen2-1-like n=2 Tax=Punica granatum TaxID=22663 RepID=A0A6P8D4D6_PUNGR|nr:tRNA-splicing endonuclease subunit Sen2-1-like [Punica granatum]XP_031389323.1 tRNA-splicing endonuclease subunit Sen2-1-like [Punica granatum]XP_031389324.1 tRNA-splicing endonuclease subunit Sen2-1-like [Punica granatum]XP_031389325.1 tRNA-splicing endonuclease subunit Sen2-1-like [Punica granatum]OWM65977.1 hypothetical protein CDL15_Pgr015402 [Punica granatum]PKI66725.1 hypothetical protein CRG98_012920 [Punica granatum]
MGPRWKGKGCEAKALSDPMSAIVSRLQSSLVDSNARGLLSGSNVILAVDLEQSDLLNSACFGRPMLTADKEKNWCQLGMEEAFYLCYFLKCLEIFCRDDCPEAVQDLWQYMINRKSTFPESYRAYSHLRAKNWVVRLGSQYGVDFVAYRHHPSLVHSEYAILVLKEGDDGSSRLRVWSDLHCSVRLSGSVAKGLLALYIDKSGHGEASPSCLNGYHVEERILARWNPEQCREDQTIPESGTKP